MAVVGTQTVNHTSGESAANNPLVGWFPSGSVVLDILTLLGLPAGTGGGISVYTR